MFRKPSENEREDAMNDSRIETWSVKTAMKNLTDDCSAKIRSKSSIRTEAESDLIFENVTETGTGFRYRVATDMAVRDRVYRFAYDIYHGVALARNGDGRVVSPHDAGPETFTLLAEDAEGTAVGTVSLVFDSEKGLPCDEIYWLETSRLRTENRHMAEVTRLALRKDIADSREVLLRLFNLIYIYARRVRGYTDFVIEVHPRHAKYYQRALGFEKAGSEQKCPRVGGAPAVLARLDLAVPEREVRRVGGLGGAIKGRSLYPRFWSADREPGLATTMADVWRPMPEHEARYFGIGETGRS